MDKIKIDSCISCVLASRSTGQKKDCKTCEEYQGGKEVDTGNKEARRKH